MSGSLVGENALLVLGMMTLLWLVSIRLRDVSIVDPWWSIAFLLVTVNSARHGTLSPPTILLLVLVASWSLRLWWHLLLRSRGKAEDPRYAGFRQRFGAERYWWLSFFQVFLLQGVLALLISAPLQLAASASSSTLTIFDRVGALLFTVGFLVEVIADRQLQAFRDDPQRRGGVLDTGLWHYSRHPNYFGEALLGWGLWLQCLDLPYGWATGLAPALMTFLLVRVSGVSMLDAHLRATKPGFAAYMERTSGFIPWPPRAAGA